MATFVLVHGAWHGSWCWKRVRRILQQRGHDVFTPALTGLGERRHLLRPDVNLETHIADVVNLLRGEELTQVVLCGHSYGGMVITGAVDQEPARIASLVYLDAFVPGDGESLFSHIPPEHQQAIRDSADRDGEGWRVPPFFSAAAFNVNEQDRAWVDRQMTPQPLAALTQPLRLSSGGLSRVQRKHYIYAAGFDVPQFTAFYQRARRERWVTSEIACGHDVMLDRPVELAAELLRAAG
jgi:pimeloyl-ACP methyl ester carboxylesterase